MRWWKEALCSEETEGSGSGSWSRCGGVGVREACCCVVRVEGGLAEVDGGRSSPTAN